jgi:hypothetical protein
MCVVVGVRFDLVWAFWVARGGGTCCGQASKARLGSASDGDVDASDLLAADYWLNQASLEIFDC